MRRMVELTPDYVREHLLSGSMATGYHHAIVLPDNPCRSDGDPEEWHVGADMFSKPVFIPSKSARWLPAMKPDIVYVFGHTNVRDAFEDLVSSVCSLQEYGSADLLTGTGGCPPNSLQRFRSSLESGNLAVITGVEVLKGTPEGRSVHPKGCCVFHVAYAAYRNTESDNNLD